MKVATALINMSTTSSSNHSSPTSSTHRRRRRQVGFNNRAAVYLISSYREYTDEEYIACFATEEDTERNNLDIVTNVKGARTLGADAQGICIRGVEYLADRTAARERRAIRKQHSDAILDEQDRQWDAGLPTDWEAIAEAAQVTSEKSLKTAQKMGDRDAAVALRGSRAGDNEKRGVPTSSDANGRIRFRRGRKVSPARAC